MTGRLQDKVTIVTGGSSGFGRAISIAFATQGAKVVVADLQPQASKGGFETAPETTTVQEIEAAGGAAAFIQCDVTKKADVA
jgi:NAD(P)-dependent dehydrogenase (short-subunit alcohol dehydrogenase family)